MPASARSKPVRRGRPTGHFTQYRRLDRLREMLESHPAGLTLEDLAGMLHVTPQSVRRYLGELDRLTDIESVPTSPGGAHLWRIKPSERGRSIVLRRTQAYGLLAVRKVFDVMRGSAFYDELGLVTRQLTQMAQRPHRPGTRGELPSDQHLEDRFVYLPHASCDYSQKGEELDHLFNAVAQLRPTSFRYRKSTAEAPRVGARESAARASNEEVTIHPYALVLYQGAVYCVGYDLRAREIEVYALDHMSDTTASESDHFTLPPDFRLEDFLEGEFGVVAPREKKRVLIEFDARVADEVRSRKFHPTQRTASAPDGRLRLSMMVSDVTKVRRWVLGFGDSARVVEPRELADEITESLRKTLTRYQARV